ncbi:facilitated trehalose transporter Tret1-2 homolog isoform X2 [Agrilus planipennis]|uniref:Facilitated trehalose transporter Tret1-2 homolog isoform X2 n=1 Tax=Agrilus planipennis TaxID=224129 RepID=A0A7F5RKT9_AGRPL|nr:facilitated trehalose transporter Tret1-2 homolog isoform X2 [Agrilus planipennis]
MKMISESNPTCTETTPLLPETKDQNRKSQDEGDLLYPHTGQPAAWKQRLKNKEVRVSRKYLYTAVAVCNLSSIALGITLTWSSPVISKLNGEVKTDDNPLGRLITIDEESWIGSLITLGAAAGPYTGGLLADRIGRRKTLILTAGVPSLISFIMLAFASDIYVYYIARFVGGISIGAIYSVLPSYISEISEDKNRGAMGSVMNVFITVGLCWSYVIGPFVTIRTFSLICATVPAVFIVWFSFFPESPYHYVAVDKPEKAEAALQRLRMATADDVRKEMELIKATVDDSKNKQLGFVDLFKSKGLTKALIISMSLVAFQQLSGINVVLFYTQTIFEATGSSISSVFSSIIIGGAQMIPSAITPCVADTAGRRATLMFSAIGQIISEIPLGLYFYLKHSGHDVSAIYWLPVACLVVYIITFRVGFGPLPWTIMAEIFPSNVKTAACTATASFCYILAFLITRFFQNLTVYIGMEGGFWLFSGFCILSAIFIYLYVPETKKKSFQEIQRILNGEN